jgi:hypothetical protein
LRQFGVPINYQQAVFWFEKAAAQKSAAAEFNLGFMYEHGPGVQLDFSKAAEYYDLGAQHGPSQQMRRKLMISLDVRRGAEDLVSKVCRVKINVIRRCRRKNKKWAIAGLSMKPRIIECDGELFVYFR